MDAHESLWTLTELAEQAAAALADGAAGQRSGRVRDVPDARTIRWYQTTGLIDRPAALRGRTALYARRHLAQLVAIKRLQAEGRQLAEIQAALAGASDRELEKLAKLPRKLAVARSDSAAPDPPARARFWSAATPLPESDSRALEDPPTSEEPAEPTTAESSFARTMPPDGPLPQAGANASDLFAVRLTAGVFLLIEPSTSGNAPSRDDLAAIRSAAQPVLDTLRSRDLVPAEGPTRNRSTKEPA